MSLKDTFVLTEGFEVLHFFGLTPRKNSSDAEFKWALQKLRHSHSIVFTLPRFTTVVTSWVHQCVPGLFLTDVLHCICQHCHGLQELVSMTLSACQFLPSLCHKTIAALQLIENTAYQKKRKQRLQHYIANWKTSKHCESSLWVWLSPGLASLGFVTSSTQGYIFCDLEDPWFRK